MSGFKVYAAIALFVLLVCFGMIAIVTAVHAQDAEWLNEWQHVVDPMHCRLVNEQDKIEVISGEDPGLYVNGVFVPNLAITPSWDANWRICDNDGWTHCVLRPGALG